MARFVNGSRADGPALDRLRILVDACARAADLGVQVPFVFMTADCDADLRAEAEALSHASVLEKPFPLERLDAFLHDELLSPKS